MVKRTKDQSQTSGMQTRLSIYLINTAQLCNYTLSRIPGSSSINMITDSCQREKALITEGALILLLFLGFIGIDRLCFTPHKKRGLIQWLIF
ncbi:MAG: hypothetical protein CR981_01690 [Proteobacteria bacterium]|nr:MAG: hypothetical protein CR981_01690 [Pseudomonadota bacterium]